MKQIILALLVLVPSVAYGYDNYEQSNPQYGTTRQIESEFVIHSIMRLDEKEIIEIADKYNLALQLFYREKYWGYCEPKIVKVYLIQSRKALSNKTYFPNEPDYDTSTEQMRGRFYKSTDRIYVASYYEFKWGFYFAHELLHHFINECGMPFKNIEEEHEMIDNFLYKHDNRF